MGAGDLVSSVREVGRAIEQRRAAQSSAGGSDSPPECSELIAAILAVARTRNLCAPARAEAKEQKLDTGALIEAIQRTTLAVIRSDKHAQTKIAEALSVPELIGRAFDENLHSDYVAALLSTSRVGDLARHFLWSLLAHLGCSSAHGSVDHQITYRELRLDEIDLTLEGRPEGARRIDVMVKSPGRVLVIENKIHAWESEAQTYDYAEVVTRRYAQRKQIHFLMLSPSGYPGNDERFNGLSYRDLFGILTALAQRPWSPGATRLLGDYMNSVGRIFLRPEILTLAACSEELRRLGYDI